jgi:hypothetical protein
MGGSSSRKVIANDASDMIAKAYVNISQSCTVSESANQSLEFNCDPYHNSVNVGDIYENNSTCENCFKRELEARQNYYALQESLWKNDGNAKVNLNIVTDYKDFYGKMIACGQFCKACNFEDISQFTVFKATTDCQAINNIKTQMSQKLTALIQQKLSNNQDALSPLAQMLGAKSSQEVVQNLTSRMSVLLSDTVIDKMNSKINQNQSTKFFQQGGDSTYGIHQKSVVKNITSFLSSNNITDKIFQQQEWEQLQTLMNQQNTIDEVGKTVSKIATEASKIIDNIVGKLMIFILVLTGLIVFSITFMLLIRYIKRKTEHGYALEDEEAELRMELASA